MSGKHDAKRKGNKSGESSFCGRGDSFIQIHKAVQDLQPLLHGEAGSESRGQSTDNGANSERCGSVSHEFLQSLAVRANRGKSIGSGPKVRAERPREPG